MTATTELLALKMVNATEARIIGALLDRILTVPELSVSVHNPEWEPGDDEADRFDCAPTRTVAALAAEIGACDETTLEVWEPGLTPQAGGPVRLGWVLLIHGNDEDVISDFGAPAACYARFAALVDGEDAK